MHHRKKRSQGGLWIPSNVVALCGHGTSGCHGWVEHNPNAAELEGFHVRPWQDEVPIRYRSFRWVILLDDGEMEDVPNAEGYQGIRGPVGLLVSR